MNFKTASKINETFTLDGDFNIKYNNVELTDPMCKGYIYANLYFFDEVQKEIDKLKQMVEKIFDEVVMELGMDANEPDKLLLEMSTRARRTIGSDGLDAIIKEYLASKGRNHIALMVDKREEVLFQQICEAIFIELTQAFYTMTLQHAADLEHGVKTFKFSNEYISAMTDRQKPMLAPAIRMIGFENNAKLNSLEISRDFTVKYIPEPMGSFTKQEDTINDQIKNFIYKYTEGAPKPAPSSVES